MTDFWCSQMVFQQVRQLPIHKCERSVSMSFPIVQFEKGDLMSRFPVREIFFCCCILE